jgi:transcriptional regulator with XRE-family HTH domain
MRRISGLSLRNVQERTQEAVKNGYLSQIENGTILKPAPETLWHLAQTYGLDYNDLLARAGHRSDTSEHNDAGLDGIPLSAIRELNAEDRQTLLDYIEFLSTRKKRGGS